MDYAINGLPLHILLVHAVVVFVPITALCTALAVLWPAARRRLGLLTPILGLFSLIVVYIAQLAGEWLLLRVGQTPAIAHHAALGLGLLPWAWALAAAAIAPWLWHRFSIGTALAARIGTTGTKVATALAVLAVLFVCGAAVVEVVLIGDAGSRAVWEGVFSPTPVAR
ncbi:hypothetical protein [Arthrobacter sp. 35W]|uniref:hypothetical protein n=1 Tax=Arthrobacter sp. 35W TaxID=1132441 RepID=UPI000478F6E4|nr:hypothetical protein [Arthrobacter sp. 35W]